MSLLNDALRKKKKEINSPQAAPLGSNTLEISKNGNKKKFFFAGILFLLFFIFAIVIWVLFLGPASSPDDTMLIKRFKKGSLGKDSNSEQASSINADSVPTVAVSSYVVEKVERAPEKIQTSTSNKDVKNKLSELKPGPLINKIKAVSKIEVQKKKTLSLKTDIEERENISQENRPSSAKLIPADMMFYKRAVRYHKSNDLKKAIQMYEKIVSKNPDFDAARFNLSAAYIQESMFSKAYPVLNYLQQKDPGNSEILLNLAIVEIGLNNPDSAIKFLKLAETKENRPDFAVYFHLGIANSKLDNFTDALTWYNKAKNIEPRNPNLLFNLGIVYERLNEYNQAVNHYEGSLKYGDSFSLEQRLYLNDRIQVLKRFLLSR